MSMLLRYYGRDNNDNDDDNDNETVDFASVAAK